MRVVFLIAGRHEVRKQSLRTDLRKAEKWHPRWDEHLAASAISGFTRLADDVIPHKVQRRSLRNWEWVRLAHLFPRQHLHGGH